MRNMGYRGSQVFPCQWCGKVFDTWNGLRVHMLSKVHLQKNVRCFNCERMFRTPSDLIMHFEQGICVRVTREGIKRAVRSWEFSSGNSNLFTSPRLGWIEEPTNGFGSGDPKLVAVELWYNGKYFECPLCPREFVSEYHAHWHLNSPAHSKQDNTIYYIIEYEAGNYLCPLCSKPFRALGHLNAHLRSAVHESEDYHCRKCECTFKLLSSLFKHFESGKCGAMSYSTVVGMADAATEHLMSLNIRPRQVEYIRYT